MDCHIHWMSDSRQSIIYKRMCKLQKCRIYPKSQVKNLVVWCRKLKNQALFPKQNLRSLYVERRRHIVTYSLESSHPYCSRIWSPRHKNQPHRRCLPLTGPEGNATMLVPTVHESNYCSHHPHRRLADQGVLLRSSQWWRTHS